MKKKEIARRMVRMARLVVGDMTWDECIAEAKKTGKRSPDAFCGWLKAHGPNAPKNSSEKQADEWTTTRKDVDKGMRNKMMLKSLTSYAPALGKELKKRMVKARAKEGISVRPNELTRKWSQYLAYIDEVNNNNK